MEKEGETYCMRREEVMRTRKVDAVSRKLPSVLLEVLKAYWILAVRVDCMAV